MRRTAESLVVVFRLAHAAGPRLVASVAALTGIQGVLVPLRALLIGFLVRDVSSGSASRASLGLALIAASVLIERALEWIGTSRRLRLRELTTLQVDLRLAHLTNSLGTIDHLETPRLLDEFEAVRQQRLTLSGAQEAAVQVFGLGVRCVVTVGALLAVAPALALFPLVVLPAALLSGRSEKLRQSIQGEVAKHRRMEYRIFEIATRPGPLKELLIYGTAHRLVDEYATTRNAVDAIEDRTQVRAALIASFGWVLSGLGFGGMLLVTVANRGGADPGDVVTAILLASQLQGQVASLLGLGGFLVSASLVARRMIALEAELTRPRAGSTSGHGFDDGLPTEGRRGIRLKDVGFRYPGTTRDVLHAIDLQIRPGSVLAIVGTNGSGKSTLVKLLCGFHRPTSGTIEVDGSPLTSIDDRVWAGQLSAVFQDYMNFELSLQQAVGVGDLDHCDDADRVRLALGNANAADLEELLPAGLLTQLGLSFRDGRELSTGQWQRVALARAMMRSAPRLTLLDEPTASVDVATEHAVFEAFAAYGRRLGNGSTATVLVSHRLAMTRFVDEIVVLKDGRIIERGTHDELIAGAGEYASLFATQAEGFRR